MCFCNPDLLGLCVLLYVDHENYDDDDDVVVVGVVLHVGGRLCGSRGANTRKVGGVGGSYLEIFGAVVSGQNPQKQMCTPCRWFDAATSSYLRTTGDNIGALPIRIGLWGPLLYCKYN